MREFLAVIGIMAAILLVVVGLNFFGLANYQFFTPKYEAARREVFENTQSYQQGSIRDFDNLYLAYVQAKSEDEKAVILDTLRHRTAGVQPDNIPPRVRSLLGQ
jgi:hypothetical protein